MASQRRRGRSAAALERALTSAIEVLENRTLLSTTTLISGFSSFDGNTNANTNAYNDAVPNINAANTDITMTQGTAPISNSATGITSNAGSGSDATSAWSGSQVAFTNFSATFTYQETFPSGGGADGITFTLQNSSSNISAIGGSGGDLGYVGAGMTPSFAVDLNIYQGSHAGDNLNGAATTLSTNTEPGVNITNGDLINVTIEYNSNTDVVYLVLQDPTTDGVFYDSWKNINLTTQLGASTAYVGFTGGDGGAWAQQDISNFTYSTSTTPLPVPGQLNGFSTFKTNAGSSNPAGVPSVSSDTNTLTLTTAAADEASSAFSNPAVAYANFTSTFTYQESGGTTPPADGFTFTLQDDSRGTSAIGGAGTDLGYSNAANPSATAISPSAAIEFNILNASSISFATNGADTVSTTTSDTGSVNLASGDPINVSINFNSNELTVTLTDTVTNSTYTTDFNSANLGAILGGSTTAYVGFTGSTGGTTGTEDAKQTITNFILTPGTSVPPPPVNSFTGFTSPMSFNAGGTVVAGVPGVSADGNTLTVTTDAGNQANSAIFNTPVTYQNFTANFTYTDVTGGGADGVTFMLEDSSSGANALGGTGGAIGYSGITPSFAVEFNIYNQSVTMADSDANGAFGFPQNDGISNTGAVNIRSGDPINVSLSYDSERFALTETLTDAVAGTSFTTHYYAVNLPNILGQSYAFLGFTGGTGGAEALQTISNFSYTTSSATPILTTPTLAAGVTSVSGFANQMFNGYADDPAGVPSVSTDTNTLTVTTGTTDQASSSFYDTPVDYGNFTASFTYTESGGTTANPADGIVFDLTTNPSLDQDGGQMGYGASQPNSFAVEFNIYQVSSTSLGAAGAISLPYNTTATTADPYGGNTGNVQLDSLRGASATGGDPINVTLQYSSSAQTLTETLTDPIGGSGGTSVSYTTTYTNVNLAQYLGNSPSAYVGFEGATGGADALQTITNYTYSANSTLPSVTQTNPQVDLTGYYNSYGIQADGTADVPTGNPSGGAFANPGGGTTGYDGGGNQLSYTYFGSTVGNQVNPVSVTGYGTTQTFDAGPVGVSGLANLVDAEGQTINLPQGKYGNISFIGSAVNGNQANQPFTVNYTDGTSQTFDVGMSDWFNGATFAPNEVVAIPMTYRLSNTGAAENQGSNISVYEYELTINANKTVASITLPDNDNDKILAINVNAAPSVTSISPTTGPVAGGTTVTINGTGFTGATAVDFGTSPATSYSVNAAGTQITAVDPASPNGGSDLVDVTVTGPYGTSATSTADQFQYGVANTLPAWLAAGSQATWNSSTKTLTVTGPSTIIADPGSDEPNIVASGSSAKVTVTPATNPTDVHIGGVTLTDGASIVMSDVDASQVAAGSNASNHASDHNVLVIGTLGAVNDPTISIDSASKLDLGDNDLIVHTGSSDAGTDDVQGFPETNELKAIEALAAEGRNIAPGGVYDGTWTGNGLTSSAAATADSGAYAGYEQNILAVEQNSDMYLGGYTKWKVGSASETLGANDIIVKYTYNGDLNLDGAVDGNAATIFSTFYDNGATSGNVYAYGDLNGDGKINGNDATIFSTVYGNGLAGSGLPQL